MKYTAVSQHPKMEAFDLISSIGGILGFYTGMSFLSFFEIVEVLTEILCISYFE